MATALKRFALLLAFAVLGLGPPMLVLFGAIDLAGGMWTAWALRQDARASQRLAASAA